MSLALLDRTLTERRPALVGEIRVFSDLLGTSIMAIGEQVNRMVAITEEQLENLRQVAEETSSSRLVGHVGHVDSALRGRLEELTSILNAQEDAARRALRVCEEIGAAALRVTDLSLAADLLALSARTEMTRLGSEHQDLASVADQLAGLNDQVTHTAQDIRTQASSLTHGLHTILRRTTRLRMQARRFIEAMDHSQQRLAQTLEVFRLQVAQGLDEAGRGLGEVLHASQEALTHLAFEDVAVQTIQRLDGLSTKLHNEVARELGQPAEHSTVHYTPLLSDQLDDGEDDEEALDAGEMFLF